MPARVSIIRRRRAFDEGRRSVADNHPMNPYQNATLKRLWEAGRAAQVAGTLKTPIPPLRPTERRAARVVPGQPKIRTLRRQEGPLGGRPGFGGGLGNGPGGGGPYGNRRDNFGKYRRPGGGPPRYR
jgi:hypothetical protein